MELVPVMRVVSITSVFFIDTQLVDCFFRSLNFVKTGFYIRVFAMFWNLFCIYWGAKFGVIGIAVSLTFANISVIVLKMVILNRMIGASQKKMLRRWFLAWKPAILPVLLGTSYIAFVQNNTLTLQILFAVLFASLVIAELVFVPNIVGREYKATVYPIISKIAKRIFNIKNA